MSKFNVDDEAIHDPTGIRVKIVETYDDNPTVVGVRTVSRNGYVYHYGDPIMLRVSSLRYALDFSENTPPPESGVELDSSDPFENVLIDIVKTNRRKRADYAVDGSPWSNFDDSANDLGIDGFSAVDSANFNIAQKNARLKSLRLNGRMNDPNNESVADTYLDRAVYSIIAYAIHRYPSGKVEQ